MHPNEARPEGDQCFAASIRKLQDHTSEVPPGWRKLYAGALEDLRAVQCAARANTIAAPVTMDAGYMELIFSGEDRVVAGIGRKLAQATACTCCICGRPGQVRTVDGDRIALCPSCWAPSLVHVELREWLTADLTGNRMYWDDVHPVIRAAIPPSSWSSFGPKGRKLLFLESESIPQIRSELEKIFVGLPSEDADS